MFSLTAKIIKNQRGIQQSCEVFLGEFFFNSQQSVLGRKIINNTHSPSAMASHDESYDRAVRYLITYRRR